MSLHGIDIDRLRSARNTVSEDLLSERNSAGHWTGQLSSSPLSTATAISALLLAHRDAALGGSAAISESASHQSFPESDWLIQCDLSELVVQSLNWLATQQNEDGGWGDTDRSLSNISTTMLVRAAFQLTGVPVRFADLVERADEYIKAEGGAATVKRRYGKDKTFAVPILTNCALAGLVPWSKVSPLPFELACIPPSWYRLAQLPVVSYAIPALVSIGQAKFYNDPPKNPLTKMVRKWAAQRSLAVLEKMQPLSGGFLEATPLTSFVVMSLASIGHRDHPVVLRGVEFLLESVREDGSWPIDTNLATWNTTLAINALADSENCETVESDSNASRQEVLEEKSLEWLLACQHHTSHPYTGAQPGGWAWTNLSGGVPDADDTPGALLALSKFYAEMPRPSVEYAAQQAATWLLDLQNRDGGFPTFCRGWGKLPFDRSSNDLTAHSLRALAAWKTIWEDSPGSDQQAICGRIDQSISRGLTFVRKHQQADGSWLPLWFGNQFHAEQANPVYGTSKVLMMFNELGLQNDVAACRGAEWLTSVQLAGGGWGPVLEANDKTRNKKREISGAQPTPLPTIEETALAVESLLPWLDMNIQFEDSISQGLDWLINAVEAGQHHQASPIGLYFAKLWYYERLYPTIFATSALTKAVEIVSHDRSNEEAYQHVASVN